MILDIFYNIIIYPIELLIEVSYSFFSTVVRYNSIFPIFGISVLVTICCLPLYAKAELIQNNERLLQKKFKNKIASIKKNFSGNEKYMILSMYYRENNYHPIMSLRGTLSLFFQIPFFIAAYHFLSNLESLKGTGFFIINDLGRPDGLLFFNLPILHTKTITINVLPILMTLINITSGYIYAKDYELKEKLQLFFISLIFLVLLYNSPSALVLYWTFNNIFSLIKNIIYKFKNPLKIFYFLVIFLLLCACIFVFFFRSQGKSSGFIFKLLTAVTSLIIALTPIYIKFLIYIKNKFFYSLQKYISTIKHIFILASVALWLLCAFVIPLNIISSDPPAFSYLGKNPNPFSFIVPAACTGFGFFVFWPVCIFFIFSNRIKTILSFVFSILLIFGICNTFFFFGDNGILSSSLIFTSASVFNFSTTFIFINTLVLLVIITLLIIIYKKNLLHIIFSLFIIFIIGGFFISIWKTAAIQRDYNSYTAIKQNNEVKFSQIENQISETNNFPSLLNLSKNGKNVIVFMLDRAIGSYLPLIFEERPELKSIYSGFTYYPNTVSFFRATILGTPPIFGGYEYTPENMHKRKDAIMAVKHTESLMIMPKLFQNEGYDVSVFDLPYVNYQEPMSKKFFTEEGIHADILQNKFNSYYFNEHPDSKPVISTNYENLLRRNFVFFGFVTISAPILRKAIYKNGSYWSVNNSGSDDTIPNFTISEYSTLYFLPQLTSYDNNANSLILLVNNLPHAPSFLQFPDYTIVSKIKNFGPERFNGNIDSQKHYHTNAATYLLLAKWIIELKENEVYDNTRIIMVSDHDELVVKPLFSNELNRINAFFNPILLVKDFNTDGDLKTDMTFMTTADVPLIAFKNIISNPANPFTGNILEADKENGANIYLGGSAYTKDFPGWETLDKTSSFYHVKDNIFEEKNWTKFTKQF